VLVKVEADKSGGRMSFATTRDVPEPQHRDTVDEPLKDTGGLL